MKSIEKAEKERDEERQSLLEKLVRRIAEVEIKFHAESVVRDILLAKIHDELLLPGHLPIVWMPEVNSFDRIEAVSLFYEVRREIRSFQRCGEEGNALLARLFSMLFVEAYEGTLAVFASVRPDLVYGAEFEAQAA